MALLLFTPLSTYSPLSSSLYASHTPIPTAPILRLQMHMNRCQHPKPFNGVGINLSLNETGRGSAVVAATSEEGVAVENLPLESKEKLKMEQKLRMKMAKKIRLRRKRLVRKRRMRKKGRWPPSKMKKNKNV